GCDKGRTPFPDGIAADRYCFQDIEGLAVDSSGALFIADNSARVVVRLSQGTLTRVAGGGAAGQFGEGLSPLNADLAGVAGIAVDSQGVLYIGELANPRIRRVGSGVITTLAGSTSSGYRDAEGTAAMFRLPAGMAVDSSLNIYVADQENFRIR